MDRRTEIRDFLTSRRARITPEQAGLKVSPLAGARRVAGLRREEVALLAGVSVPYYTRLERGDARGATDAVLDAISRALLLDDAERAHLFDLVRAANATAAAAGPAPPGPAAGTPGTADMLEAMNGVPAYVRNGRLDILAGNALAQALFAPIFTSPARPVNAARFAFLTPPPPSSTPTGTPSPTRTSPPCAPRSAATLRQGPVRPDRRAVHPQRHLPAALGPARSPAAPRPAPSA